MIFSLAIFCWRRLPWESITQLIQWQIPDATEAHGLILCSPVVIKAQDDFPIFTCLEVVELQEPHDVPLQDLGDPGNLRCLGFPDFGSQILVPDVLQPQLWVVLAELPELVVRFLVNERYLHGS